MNKYYGIDPGVSGAIAVIDPGLNVLALDDWPGDIESAACMYRELYMEHKPSLICLEHVTSMPKQGLSSTFKLGQNLGGWQGILSALSTRYRLVRPREWQMMFDPGTGKNPKERSLTTARRLFPDAELHLRFR